MNLLNTLTNDGFTVTMHSASAWPNIWEAHKPVSDTEVQVISYNVEGDGMAESWARGTIAADKMIDGLADWFEVAGEEVFDTSEELIAAA